MCALSQKETETQMVLSMLEEEGGHSPTSIVCSHLIIKPGYIKIDTHFIKIPDSSLKKKKKLVWNMINTEVFKTAFHYGLETSRKGASFKLLFSFLSLIKKRTDDLLNSQVLASLQGLYLLLQEFSS